MQINQYAEDLMLAIEYDISAIPIIKLVKTDPCSAYDCKFVALAKLLKNPLITADKQNLEECPDVAKTIEQFTV